MKIPTILAQAEVPGSLPSVGVSNQGVVSGYQNLVSNLQRISSAAGQLADIQRQQQAQQDKDAALDLFSGAAEKAELIREQAKLPQSEDNPHGAPEGQAASQGYVERYLKGYDDMARELVRTAPNDEVKRLVNNGLIRLRGESAAHVTKDQFALYKDEQIAGAPARLETYRAQIINNPGQRDTLSLARDLYIDTLTHVPASQRAKMKLEEQQKADMGIAQRDVNQDPFASIDKHAANLSPENFYKLTLHQESRQKQAIAFEDKRDKEAKANADERRKYIVDDFDSKANRGELTIDQLESAREKRDVTGEDYRRLAKRVLEEKDVPDVPAERERILLGVRGLNPSVTERDIRAARGANQISLKTATEAIDTLRITQHALKGEGDSQLKADHAQAEQLLRAALGIQYGTGQIIADAMKNDPAGRLYFSGLDELSRRSRLFQGAYGGKENPLIVVDEIGQRLNRALMTSNGNRLKEVQGTLRFQTPQDLEQAKRSGVIGDSAYVLELRKFSEIDRLSAPAVNLPKTGGGEAKPAAGESKRLEYKPSGR